MLCFQGRLVHAFITSSRVDFCNGLLIKIIRELSSYRMLMTPVLWSPVTFRIDFGVVLLVYKSLNALGPKYIADMLNESKQIIRTASAKNTKGYLKGLNFLG